MLRVGLTGGIASGKSTVAEFFRQLGAPIVDTDHLAREVVAPGEPGLAAVVEAFGPEIVAADGTLERSRLRRIVFGDAAARRQLEQILHPLIRARALRALAAIEADYAIVVVPLLVETDFAALVDRVLVVDCPPEDQLARLRERESISQEDALAMLAAQADRQTRLTAADDVIDNAGDLGRTRAQVVELDHRYRKLARVYPT